MNKIEYSEGKKVAGAYMLTHVLSGRFYIGSSSNLYFRTKYHEHKLRVGTHEVTALQSDYNQDSDIVFKYWITDTEEQARRTEEELVSFYWTDVNLYNQAYLIPGVGRRFTEEQRQEHSARLKNIPRSDEAKERMAVAQRLSWKKGNRTWTEGGGKAKRPVEINGKIYASISEAARQLDLIHMTVLKRVQSTSHKFQEWKYVNFDE